MIASEKRLLASIHDVSPRFTREVDMLADRLSKYLGGSRFALLVVPDYWAGAPIAHDSAFKHRLQDWHRSGAEIFLHGWYHRDEITHYGRISAYKARHLTAGEGEFLGLSHSEALRRMRAGRALLEDIIGAPLAGFVAPAWLYGPGARSALTEAGFALAEDHFKVWRPADNAVLTRGPVITWASRSPARIASSRLFAAVARHALVPLKTIRLALHPGDVGVSELLASIDLTCRRLLRDRVAGRYGDLLL